MELRTCRPRWRAEAERAVTAILIAAVLFTGGCRRLLELTEERRAPVRYLIPEGFVGWVQIDFGDGRSAPASPEGEYRVFQIPPDGRLRTSTQFETGSATDQYFYLDANGGRREIPLTAWGQGGMIWAGSTGDSIEGGIQSLIHLRFFVGSEEQLRAFEATSRGFPPPIGPWTPPGAAPAPTAPPAD